MTCPSTASTVGEAPKGKKMEVLSVTVTGHMATNRKPRGGTAVFSDGRSYDYSLDHQNEDGEINFWTTRKVYEAWQTLMFSSKKRSAALHAYLDAGKPVAYESIVVRMDYIGASGELQQC